MELRFFQVDAFAPQPLTGNPAAVVPLERWLPDELMQKIAAENNLAETAFFAPEGDGYRIRWFTPEIEIDLCGHATLASGFVLDLFVKPGIGRVVFQSKSGPLSVEPKGERYQLDFPSQPPTPMEGAAVAEALGQPVLECWRSTKILALVKDEAAVRAAKPDLAKSKALGLGIIVTAPGDSVDFVSRYFAPYAGIFEDPVTGSAHCILAPFWAKRLGKTLFAAKQVSKRGGDLTVELRGERVLIQGDARLYLEGRIFV